MPWRILVRMGRAVRLVIAVIGAVAASSATASAQSEPAPEGGPPAWSPFELTHVRPTGQPVIPVFEGWFENADGSATLSFGYFNMNSRETIDLPIGPDNRITPAGLDGGQPTRFLPAEAERARHSRHQSVFAVRVPPGFEGPVVWTIRHRGRSYSVPGRLSAEYRIDDRESGTEAPVAATIRVGGMAIRGRGERVAETGLEAVAGVPLRLSVVVDTEGRPRSEVTWYEHQGPGPVTFDDAATEVRGTGGEVTTVATFGDPGDYVVRVTALETQSALVQYCCWTNAYLRVRVRE